MRVLVLGGTGTVGASVIQCLVGRGHKVSALARSAVSAGRLRDMGARSLSGDIRDPEQWLGETIQWLLVHREDLAVLYALALERGRPGAAYNGASMPGVPVGEIARGIARRFGCGDEAPLVRPVEEVVVELGEWARGYALDQRMSSEKARRDLGWEPTRVDIFGAL